MCSTKRRLGFCCFETSRPHGCFIDFFIAFMGLRLFCDSCIAAKNVAIECVFSYIWDGYRYIIVHLNSLVIIIFFWVNVSTTYYLNDFSTNDFAYWRTSIDDLALYKFLNYYLDVSLYVIISFSVINIRWLCR